MGYLDMEMLGDEDELLRRNIHRFVEDVLRPISLRLDRMNPRDRVKPDSPIFDAIREMKRMGLHRIHLPKERGGAGLTNLQRYIIVEELGNAAKIIRLIKSVLDVNGIMSAKSGMFFPDNLQ